MSDKIPEALAVLDRRIASLAGGAPSSKRVRTRAELIKVRAALTKLIEAAKRVSDVGKNADFVSGVCCCGTSIDRHPHPVHADHAPVDTGERYGREAIDSLDEALAAVEKLP